MRIFIVDDEEISCRGLSGMIGRIIGDDGNEINIFTSSVKAFEQAALLHPELIFLDIIMPEMDGIEFTERINEIYSPRIVIISGNDDYSYVRQCFKMNVVDYFLKPIEFAELENFMTKLSGELQDAYPAEANHSGFSGLFTSVIKGVDVPEDFLAAVGTISRNDSLHGNVEIEKTNGQYGDTVLTFHLQNQEDYGLCSSEFENCFYALAKSCGIVYKAAYSGIYPEEDSEQSRREVLTILHSRLYSETPLCYTRRDTVVCEDNDNPEFFRQLAALPGFISYDDGVYYRKFVDAWFIPQKLQKLPYKTIHKQYDGVISRLINSSRLDDDLEIVNFREFNTINEIISEVNRTVDAITNYFLENNQNDISIVGLIVKYIADNFQKNLTLATVSNYFNLNYSYFSRIFKKHIGISFSQYLLKIRMEKAKELLINNSDLRISDVAKLVGYGSDNVQNFTRAFKNYFGKSPKKYKKIT